MIVFACISPHPPLILPEVGSSSDRQKVKKTIESLELLAPKLKKVDPDLIIISSPHPDWGFKVPLHFLTSTINHQSLNIKPYLTDLESPRVHFEKGQAIAKSLPKKAQVAWIASGDMSHRLKEDGPYGFAPAGPMFDEEFIGLLKKKDIQGILNMDPKLIDQAGECGLRSFCMLLGALEASKVKWQPEILSYEGPFGVGYLVANIQINTNKNNSNE